MTHTALVNAALSGFLVVMTVLLVMCILAVIVSPSQVPSSHAAQSRQDGAPSLPLPPAPPLATTPAPLLLRGQPPVTAPAAGFNGWRVPDPGTTELGAPLPLMHDRVPQPEVSGKPPWELLMHGRIPRPEVSGSPPWGPAPEPPPGMDG
jgi:hypothetical protein